MISNLEFCGQWVGVLQISRVETLRLVLEIDSSGVVSLISLDQGQKRIPASDGFSCESFLEISFASVHGCLKVHLISGDVLEGTWTQKSALPIRFIKSLPGESSSTLLVRIPLSDVLHRARQLCGSPAMVAGWWHSGISAFEVDGFRSATSETKVELDDLWHCGSITKAMTATMVARLVERGVFRWEDLVGDLFKDIAPEMNSAYRPATLLQLITGQSGLPSNLPMRRFQQFQREEEDARQSRLCWVREALSMAPEGPLGQGHIYPNSAFVIIGSLCEFRMNCTWEDLMVSEVFRPLNMVSAGFGPPISSAKAPSQPVGHRRAYFGKHPVPCVGVDNPAVMGPAGRVHMTLSDLLTFGRAHLSGLLGSSDGAPAEYLTPHSWQRLHTPAPHSSYALGWLRQPDGSSWHNGSNTFFYAELCVDPAKRCVTVVATNFIQGDKCRETVAQVMNAVKNIAICAS